MKIRIAFLSIILMAASAAPTTPAFEKMKGLAGEWKANVPGVGEFHDKFSIQSGGSSLLEEMTEPNGTSMVTIYYPLDGGVAMTHYCSAHNQPHMTSVSDAVSTKQLTFKTVSVDNLKSKNDGHMAGVTFTFKDADHFDAAWDFKVNGTSAPHPGFEYVRVK